MAIKIEIILYFNLLNLRLYHPAHPSFLSVSHVWMYSCFQPSSLKKYNQELMELGLVLGSHESGKSVLLKRLRHYVDWLAQESRASSASSALNSFHVGKKIFSSTSSRGQAIGIFRHHASDCPIYPPEEERHQPASFENLVTIPTIGVDVEEFQLVSPGQPRRCHAFQLREIGASMTPIWPSYFSTSHFLIVRVCVCVSS